MTATVRRTDPEDGDGVLLTVIDLQMGHLMQVEEGAVSIVADALFMVVATSPLLTLPMAPPDEALVDDEALVASQELPTTTAT